MPLLAHLSFAVLIPFVVPAPVPGQNPEDQLTAARALVQSSKYEQAIVLLNPLASAANHRLKGVEHELGTAYYHLADYTNAILHLSEAAREDEDDRTAVQLLGLSYYLSGKPAEAIPHLERVRSWRSGASLDALYVLGLCYLLTRRYPEARDAFAMLYGVPGDSPAAHLILARMLVRQGFDPIAKDEVARALEQAPGLPFAHFVLGELAMYKSDYSGAVSEFQKEVAINPGYAGPLTRLGDAYAYLGRYDDAERVLQRSLWLDSTDAEPLALLGKVLLAKRQLELAERTLQRAVSISPNSYSAHFFLGKVYREMGRAELAQREMSLAAQIQQSHTQTSPR